MRIDGSVEGDLRLDDAAVAVGPSGHVTGDVDARDVVIEGNVCGNLRVLGRVQIGPTGVVTGDVATERLIISEGAVVRSRVQMPVGPDSRTHRTAAGGARRPERGVFYQAKEPSK